MRLTAGTAVIAGTVLTEEATPRPLRRVLLSLNAAGGPSVGRVTTTDDQGRFVFTKLGAGNYSALRATKPGYVAAAYGQKRVGGIGVPITLAEGQRVNLVVKMTRGGVITGMLTDEGGKPAVQVQVQAMPVRVVSGERQPTGTFGGSGMTDDRGVYRIYGLAAGDFVVSASPRSMTGEVRPVTAAEVRWAQQQLQPAGASAPAGAGMPAGAGVAGQTSAAGAPPPRPGQAVANATVYYPGTADSATAGLITVGAGQEVAGMDFRVTLVPTAKVEGTLVDPDGQPPQNVQMNLIPKAGSSAMIGAGLMMDVFGNRPQVANGKFTFSGVKPGEYMLTARAVPRSAGTTGTTGAMGGRGMPMPPPTSLWAMADVTVAGMDQSGIVVRLEPGMTVSGRIAFEGTTLQPPAEMSRVSLNLRTAPNPSGMTISINPSNTVVAPDGTFSFTGITPGRYLLSGNPPAAAPVAGVTWQMKSAIVAGVDVADHAVEVKPGENIADLVLTFTDKTAEVSGTLSDAAGKPTSEFSVILFSVDKAAWQLRSRRWRQPVRAGTDGKFKFVNLPPGDYYVAALTDFEQADLNSPSFLEQVAATGAIRITVAEGEKKVQDLKLAGGT